MSSTQPLRVGLVGARGYVGRELVRLLLRHERLSLAFVASRSDVGTPIAKLVPGAPASLLVQDLSPEAIAKQGVDAVFLALPNNLSGPVVEALEREAPNTVILDLSADNRFNDGFVYGLPEHHRDRLRGARRVACPGCYATSMALVVKPVAHLLAAPAACFGVSGFSGAGTTPSPKNDSEVLKDNLLPYSLTGHVHEREVTRHAGPVFFMPHVAPFFRGITTTVSLSLREPISKDQLRAIYAGSLMGEPLVSVTEDIPLVSAVRDTPFAVLGGMEVSPDGHHAVVVSTLDNLLKGAASQALQAANLALGLSETMGILPWPA